MSQQNVVDFFTQAENDSTLKQRIQAVANKEDLLKLAQESGYSFTEDELKAVAKEAESDELNEEQLEAVAGGTIYRGGLRDCHRRFKAHW